MTTANKITILRILLIPFFVVQVLYYVKNGNEAHRLAAILSFAIAAICDGVDGYIARWDNYWPRHSDTGWDAGNPDDGRKSESASSHGWKSRDRASNDCHSVGAAQM